MDNSLHPPSSVDHTLPATSSMAPTSPEVPRLFSKRSVRFHTQQDGVPLKLLDPSAVRGSLQYEHLCSVALVWPLIASWPPELAQPLCLFLSHSQAPLCVSRAGFLQEPLRVTQGLLWMVQPDPDPPPALRSRPSPSSQIPVTHCPVPQQEFNEHLLCARQQGKVVPEHKALSLEERALTRGQLVSCAGYDEGGDSRDVTPGTQGREHFPGGGGWS